MAGKIVPSAHAAVTGATSAGLVTVADSTKFNVGAFVWLSGVAGNVYCKVTDCPDATHVGLRVLDDPSIDATQGQRVRGPSYGRSDVSAYNAGGFLDQEEQLIYSVNADNTLPSRA